jgi:hypothetical protein
VEFQQLRDLLLDYSSVAIQPLHKNPSAKSIVFQKSVVSSDNSTEKEIIRKAEESHELSAENPALMSSDEKIKHNTEGEVEQEGLLGPYPENVAAEQLENKNSLSSRQIEIEPLVLRGPGPGSFFFGALQHVYNEQGMHMRNNSMLENAGPSVIMEMLHESLERYTKEVDSRRSLATYSFAFIVMLRQLVYSIFC